MRGFGCTAGGKRAVEVRGFVYISRVDGHQIHPKWPFVLKIKGGVRIPIAHARNATWKRTHIHAIGSYFQIIQSPGLLPCQPPVRCNSMNVECKVRAGQRLRTPQVFRAIQGETGIQMVIPQRVCA